MSDQKLEMSTGPNTAVCKYTSNAGTGGDQNVSNHSPTKTMPFLLEVSKAGFVRHEEKLTGTACYEKEIVLQPAKK